MTTTIAPSRAIEITPGIAGGKPRIAGTRFTVKQIATWHEFMGLSADEIAHEYGLELSDIHAALSYFYTHREAILRAIREEEVLVETLKARHASKLPRRHA